MAPGEPELEVVPLPLVEPPVDEDEELPLPLVPEDELPFDPPEPPEPPEVPFDESEEDPVPLPEPSVLAGVPWMVMVPSPEAFVSKLCVSPFLETVTTETLLTWMVMDCVTV